MKKKMLQFVDLKQETPEKRSTSKRKKDFNEIYNESITDKAKEQPKQVFSMWSPLLPNSLSIK